MALELGEKISFENDGTDFSGVRAAEKRCQENGYSVGSMARGMRIGIKKGNYCNAKRYNLDKEDIERLDGYMTHDGNGYRHGTIWIVIFDTPPK